MRLHWSVQILQHSSENQVVGLLIIIYLKKQVFFLRRQAIPFQSYLFVQG